MCRWGAWIGAPVFLEELLSRPEHSLISQARHATEAKTEINADGFGVAWYDHRPEPGLYRDVFPAWSDPNLTSIAQQIKSPLYLAHVRASTGTATSRNNCHPFAVGCWSFMHNGQFGGFEQFRQQTDARILPPLYPHRKGATDSEALFLLALGEGLEQDPYLAMARAIGWLEEQAEATGTTPYTRCTAAFSDGETLYAVRYASDNFAPSLYHRWCDHRKGRAIVSEPVDVTQSNWKAIPPGSFATFTAETVKILPFEPVRPVQRRVA
ncbi:class II glutamine amidotransferase [Pontivivens insulae]|uniref:Gamma-glutamyl-hercynylcysteine sulfoxide hydrolase n=1 Tax=Pontivivens insulae TaxID=1639689 RepID=A0A2R8ABK6_9RHOB|nr:class II glutamine amidotransferase [Pontivivens insulae]RED11221.1 glutamine amidotransferase [Pontivivens insulae]SPF29606.1 Gamma-glutamyl-hercynylcysteine sulfoxide hydrolase [Pontivivens insulae]